ncbi:hypothetical protein SCANM63S_00809 [Streptomyces canarius]
MTTATPPATAVPWERPASWRRLTAALRARLLARTRAGTTQAAPGTEPRTGTRTTVEAGRPPGIEELYHHRRLSLVRLAVLLVDDLPTAEDVVQDAFTALFRRHGHRLARLDDPEAYLRTSVVNAARSVLRRRRTARAHAPVPEGHAPPPRRTCCCTRTTGRCWRRWAR